MGGRQKNGDKLRCVGQYKNKRHKIALNYTRDDLKNKVKSLSTQV